MDDNLYPNNGEYFLPTEPEEQKLDRKKEQAKVLEAKKLSDEIIARYEDRIVFYDTIDSIEVELRTDPEKFMRAWLVNREIKAILESECAWLEELVEQYQR